MPRYSTPKKKLWGDPLDLNNPFHFDKVVLNLPGDPSYSPGKPWEYKYRTIDDWIAIDLFIYVDDCWTTGFSFHGLEMHQTCC